MRHATRIGLVLAFPFLLGFGASALADDTPKPPAKPDATAKPAAGAKLAWLSDYDAAKKKAAEEKKGLLVYLTPAWFT